MPVIFENAFRVEDGISLEDLLGVFGGTNDPSILPGEVAPIGSLYVRTKGELYQKIGPNDVDWDRFLRVSSVPITTITVDGQTVLAAEDSIRNKVLSIDTTSFTFSEGVLSSFDWVEIGDANSSRSGYILPFNATLVSVTAHCANATSGGRGIDLYVDNTLIQTLGTFSNGTDATFKDNTLNVDVNELQKIRLRANSSGGDLRDILITLWVKWRE